VVNLPARLKPTEASAGRRPPAVGRRRVRRKNNVRGAPLERASSPA